MRIFLATVIILESMLLSCKPSEEPKPGPAIAPSSQQGSVQSKPVQTNLEMFATPMKVLAISGQLDDAETVKLAALSTGQVFMLECDGGPSPVSAKWLNYSKAISFASIPADAVLIACDRTNFITTDELEDGQIGLRLLDGRAGALRRASSAASQEEDNAEDIEEASIGGWNKTPTRLFGMGSAAYTSAMYAWSAVRAKAGYEIPERRKEMYEVIVALGFEQAPPGSPAAAVASAARLYGGVVSKETSDRADPHFIRFFRDNADLMRQDSPAARKVWAEAEQRIIQEHGGWVMRLTNRMMGVSGRVAYANGQKARAIPLYTPVVDASDAGEQTTTQL